MMAYNKPEVTEVFFSLEAIQSQSMKVQASVLEMPAFPYLCTPQAYEADE